MIALTDSTSHRSRTLPTVSRKLSQLNGKFVNVRKDSRVFGCSELSPDVTQLIMSVALSHKEL